MKTTSIFVAVAALLSYVAANPLPADLDFDPEAVTSPSTNSSEPALSPRCSWDDGHGPVDCSAFSVVFGDSSFEGHGNSVQVMGSNFKINFDLNCNKAADFTGYNSPLPFVLSIRPGNVCYTKPNPEAYDGTHIRYANQFINLPTDPRCGRVHRFNKVNQCKPM